MNELIFLSHIFVVVIITFIALRMGSEMLTLVHAFFVVLANFFCAKITVLFGMHACVGDAFVIGAVLSLDLIREHFGKQKAQKTRYSLMVIMLAFIVLSYIQIAYIPSPEDTAHPFYQAILSTSPRIFISSMLITILMQQYDLYIFSWLKKHMQSFPFRFTIASLISQLFDTILFFFLALYGIVEHIWSLIFFSYVIKVITIFVMAPLTAFAKKLAKTKLEEIKRLNESELDPV